MFDTFNGTRRTIIALKLIKIIIKYLLENKLMRIAEYCCIIYKGLFTLDRRRFFLQFYVYKSTLYLYCNYRINAIKHLNFTYLLIVFVDQVHLICIFVNYKLQIITIITLKSVL